jgi:hypothetical protein
LGQTAEDFRMAGSSPMPSLLEFERTYEEVKDKRLYATNVRLSGIERTKPELIERELQPLKDARSLDEIKDVLLEVHENLMALDIFDAVEIIVGDSDMVRPLMASPTFRSLLVCNCICEGEKSVTIAFVIYGTHT